MSNFKLNPSFFLTGKQSITEDDINEVTKVLQSDFLTQGPKVPIL